MQHPYIYSKIAKIRDFPQIIRKIAYGLVYAVPKTLI